MTRSWKDVKAEKARREIANGRDVDAAHVEARTQTQAYVLGFVGQMEHPRSPQSLVQEFHEKYGAAVDERTDEVVRLRARLLEEEFEEVFNELVEVWQVPEDYDTRPVDDINLTALAKELADLVYVIYGTAVSLGIDLNLALTRVHASNMSKTLPSGEKPNVPKKIQKGPDYQPPDLTGVVKEIN